MFQIRFIIWELHHPWHAGLLVNYGTIYIVAWSGLPPTTWSCFKVFICTMQYVLCNSLICFSILYLWVGTWGLGLGCGCKTILFHMDKVSFEIEVQSPFKVVRRSKGFKILISGVFIVHVDFCSSFVKISMWSKYAIVWYWIAKIPHNKSFEVDKNFSYTNHDSQLHNCIRSCLPFSSSPKWLK